MVKTPGGDNVGMEGQDVASRVRRRIGAAIVERAGCWPVRAGSLRTGRCGGCTRMRRCSPAGSGRWCCSRRIRWQWPRWPGIRGTAATCGGACSAPATSSPSAHSARPRGWRRRSLPHGVLVGYLQMLGPDHADTETARSNLASAYLAGGRNNVSEVAELFQEVLAAFERILGPVHPIPSPLATTLRWPAQASATSAVSRGHANEDVRQPPPTGPGGRPYGCPG